MGCLRGTWAIRQQNFSLKVREAAIHVTATHNAWALITTRDAADSKATAKGSCSGELRQGSKNVRGDAVLACLSLYKQAHAALFGVLHVLITTQAVMSRYTSAAGIAAELGASCLFTGSPVHPM